jgi:FtsH-binding integral membrane protein
MANRSDQQVGQISLGKQIVLHLAPGVLATALFVLLNTLLPVERVPSILILQICLFLVLIPSELGIVLFIAKRQTGKASIKQAIRFTSTLK